jgi:hypothetical protein
VNTIGTGIQNIIKLLKHGIQLKQETYFAWHFSKNNHVISYCSLDEKEFREIYILHELVHAFHYETLPPLFSSNPNIIPISFNEDEEVNCYFNIVRDWFVFGYLFDLCPEETVSLIRYEKEDIEKKYSPDTPVQDKLIAGLVCAQEKYFLRQESGRLIGDRIIRNVADILLSTAPNVASVESLYTAVGCLFDVFGYFRFDLVAESSGETRIVKQIKRIDRIDPGRLRRLLNGFSL